MASFVGTDTFTRGLFKVSKSEHFYPPNGDREANTAEKRPGVYIVKESYAKKNQNLEHNVTWIFLNDFYYLSV